MPFDRNKYSPEWPKIRAAILKRAGDRCEKCGVKNHERGDRGEDGTWMPSLTGKTKIVLTIAHVDHDTSNDTWGNLRAWCQRCHLSHDALLHQKHAAETRIKKSRQRTMYDLLGI